MEGASRNSGNAKLGKSLPHFKSSATRERHCKNRIWRERTRCHTVGNAIGDRTCFPCPCASKNSQWPFHLQGNSALIRVKRVKKSIRVWHIHRTIVPLTMEKPMCIMGTVAGQASLGSQASRFHTSPQAGHTQWMLGPVHSLHRCEEHRAIHSG
ncbi:Uncharacterised protein [Chlamydia trachomatis]|nr:Uncharacterised protein [Chlamydia trachomatis]